MKKVGAVDLFCGAGGLTYGLQKSGIKVVAGIDADQSCKYSFEHNNQSNFISEDIKNIKGEDVKLLLQDFDIKIIVGCAPCQPFSNHQKNKYHRDQHKDWGLLNEFLRIVSESCPDIVSMENVPQLKDEKIFFDFICGLEKLQYNVTFSVVKSHEYGVPQKRHRLLLLASKFGNISLIKPTHLHDFVTVADTIHNLPSISAGEICSLDPIHTSPKLSHKNIERIRQSKPSGTWHDWNPDLLPNCYRRSTGKSYSSVYGRMSWDKPSPTITTQFNYYGTGRFGHPEQDRALSLREGALLQTFPLDYKFYDEENVIKSYKVIARQIGNAVPPRLGEVVGESIINHINGE